MRAHVAPSSEQTTSHLDPRRWLMLVIVLYATFMDALDTFIVNVAMLGTALLRREPPGQHAHRLDYSGVTLLTISLFLFIFPLT